MDGELLALAAAPTTRGLVESLSERLGSANPVALSEEALAEGELRAAVNFALAGAVIGSPPPAELVTRLVIVLENTDVAIALMGTVQEGLADALTESANRHVDTPSRLGLKLFFAAASLEGRAPPDELLRRIRLTSRAVELDLQGRILVGLAALEVGDAEVLEVAAACVTVADCPAGRRIGRELLQKLRAPFVETLPEEPPPDFFGGFTIQRAAPRTGRNDPCPCGSGRKYKRCCVSKEPADLPTADPTHPWGDRARFHKSMSEAQFRGLHPLEVSRIPPARLTTQRLLHAVLSMSEHRYFDDAMRYFDELQARGDLPDGTTPDSVRVEMIRHAAATKEPEWVERIVATFENPDAVPKHIGLAVAILKRSPDALERIEALADRALREPSEDALGSLFSVLIFFAPALGILLARGTMDPEEPGDMEITLNTVEEARDVLLLPPHDPAWEIYDLLSERHLLAQLDASTEEMNEKLVAEAEDMKRSLAETRARELAARRSLASREQALERALLRAEEQAEKAEAARRTAGPSSQEVQRLRKKVEGLKTIIAAGNQERRSLRRNLSRIGSELDEASKEQPAPGADEDEEGLEYEEEYRPERFAIRIPIFSREFRDGLTSVADYVARDAIATAGALAAADPGAWSSVKKVRHIAGLLSCRIGRHRALFHLVGDYELEFDRLIHRRDLESTLKKMG